MALAFPLTLAQFLNLVPIFEQSFDLSESLQTNETGGGEILTSDYGARLWQGSFSVQAHSKEVADSIVARAELLRSAGASFLVAPRHRAGPAADPTGSIMGAATPTFTTVNANMRDVNIGGLPANYVITQGDLVSFQYLTSPVRRALHRVVTGGTANGSGAVTNIELSPTLRPGAVAGIALTFVNPVCKAVLVPGAFDWGRMGLVSTGVGKFSWRQTLR